jgi:aldehyde:ferredoxin oxidoreductase
MDTIRRKLLWVDMSAGRCVEEALPSRYATLAGRALASAIIAAETRPDHDPLGVDALLVFAPGLLGAEHAPRPRRLAVACKSPRDGSFAHGNTGGQAGDCLASLGIAALVISGQGNGPWRRLRIAPDGAVLLPAPDETGPDAAGLPEQDSGGIGSPAPSSLIDETGSAAVASIRIGPSGELLLPTACLALSDADGQPPKTVCAGGSGAVMGAKRLREISLPATPPKLARPADGPSLFCAPDCPIRCRDGAGASGRKNPAEHGIGAALKRETGLTDPERLDAFMSLCDNLMVDAFAVARALGLALRASASPPEARPAAFDRLLEDIRNATPLGLAVASGPEAVRAYLGLPAEAEIVAADKTDNPLTAALMDSLGLCRFAAKAALATPQALDSLTAALALELGRPIDAATLTALGEGALRREREYSRRS